MAHGDQFLVLFSAPPFLYPIINSLWKASPCLQRIPHRALNGTDFHISNPNFITFHIASRWRLSVGSALLINDWASSSLFYLVNVICHPGPAPGISQVSPLQGHALSTCFLRALSGIYQVVYIDISRRSVVLSEFLSKWTPTIAEGHTGSNHTVTWLSNMKTNINCTSMKKCT